MKIYTTARPCSHNKLLRQRTATCVFPPKLCLEYDSSTYPPSVIALSAEFGRVDYVKGMYMNKKSEETIKNTITMCCTKFSNICYFSYIS